MKYKYLITSRYTKLNGTYGFSEGFSEDCVTIDYKLNTIENINKIREGIKRNYNFKDLIILNIMRLKK